MNLVLSFILVIFNYHSINYVENKFPLTGGPLGQANFPRRKIRNLMTKSIRQEKGKCQKL